MSCTRAQRSCCAGRWSAGATALRVHQPLTVRLSPPLDAAGLYPVLWSTADDMLPPVAAAEPWLRISSSAARRSGSGPRGLRSERCCQGARAC